MNRRDFITGTTSGVVGAVGAGGGSDRASAAGRGQRGAARGAGGQGLLSRDIGRDRADARAPGRHDRRLPGAPGGTRQVPRRGGRPSHARLGRADHRDHPQVRPARLCGHLSEPALPRRQGDARGQLRQRAGGRRHAGRPHDGRHRRRHPASARPALSERQGGDHRLLFRRPAGLPGRLHAQGHRRRGGLLPRRRRGGQRGADAAATRGSARLHEGPELSAARHLRQGGQAPLAGARGQDRGRTHEVRQDPRAPCRTTDAGHSIFAIDRADYRPVAAQEGWKSIFEWYEKYLG